MPLKLNSSGGGSVTLDTPSTASAYTLTVPAITGTAVVTGSTGTVSTAMITDGSVTQAKLATGVAGNGPAFSAYASTATNTTTAAWTKIVFAAEEFDTANCFSTSTYAFTPNVAGYYQLNACVFSSSLPSTMGIALYKNGAQFKTGALSGGATAYRVTVSALIYFNGTTDYVDVYWYQASGGTVNNTAGAEFTYFQGALVRAA